jgi:hypothetical protein
MSYGETRGQAIGNTERLAIKVIADRIEHRELPSSALNVSFTISDVQLVRRIVTEQRELPLPLQSSCNLLESFFLFRA